MSVREWDEEDTLGDQSAPGAPVAPQPDPPVLQRVYPGVDAWVTEWFAPMFARHTGPDRRWCAYWWEHEEAVLLLQDMWRAWETLRLKEDLGMSVWIREHLYPLLDRLMAEGGPFQSCAEDQHNPPPALPVRPAPAGWLTITAEERRRYR